MNDCATGANIEQNENSCSKAIIWLVIITGIVRLIIAAVTGLGNGESYYATGVTHPQLSYFDQPPLAFWLAHISAKIFGTFTPLALRLPTVLLFAGTTWLMYVFARRFFGAKAGLWAALALNLSAVFTFTGAVWMQPDGPMMFFWMATAVCLQSIFFREFPDGQSAKKWRWSMGCIGLWLLAGLLLGLTTLSKYHAAFLFAGAGLYAITSPKSRHWIWHPGPYIALAINFVISAPVFLWNAENGWVSFLFQAGRAGTGEGFSLHFGWLIQSIAGQALWLMPWIWLPLLWQLVSCIHAGSKSGARWFCACTAILPIVFFTVVTLWSNLGFHFHWQAPGYMMLFPPLGCALSSLMSNSGKARKWTLRFVWLSALCTVFFGIILQIHAATGFWKPYGPKWFGRLLGEKYDPTMEGYDYKHLIERFRREGWLEQENLFVATPRWWLSGKIDWALQGKMPVLSSDDDPRNIAFFYDMSDFDGDDCIYISLNSEQNNNDVLNNYFTSFRKLDDHAVIRGDDEEMRLKIYYAKDFRNHFPWPYGKGISEKSQTSGN